MPRIVRVLAVPGLGTQSAESEIVSIGLVLDDGRSAWGDCAGVVRDSILRAEEGVATIRKIVAPALEERPLAAFHVMSAEVDTWTETALVTRARRLDQGPLSRRELFQAPGRLWQSLNKDDQRSASRLVVTEQVAEERRLHAAIRYGVSQALLEAVAIYRGVTMAEVVADEYGLPWLAAPIPLHLQVGADREADVDKLILHRVASLSHVLDDNLPELLGSDGAQLAQHVRWLAGRIGQLGGPDYQPVIHLDVRGELGKLCNNEPGKVLGHLYALETAAQPYALRVECPILLDSRQAQIQALHTLREYARSRKLKLQIVAGEWANTLEDIRALIEGQAADMIHIRIPELGGLHNSIEAIRRCQAAGVGAFLGSSHAETDLSARAAIHVALATRPDIFMPPPGLSVNRAISLAHNEMARTLAVYKEDYGRQL